MPCLRDRVQGVFSETQVVPARTSPTLYELTVYVITVCDDANEAFPFFPGARNRLHWSLEDPGRAEGSEKERLAVFRRVRDEIREHIEQELVHNK